ncbi:DUF975 family protein [Alkaliphilus transvaalensis]|uniref:DUF975 family protein n=1 Tax=Alkaliphilus transvaalensis TaxID=114628 RepID=UPI00047B66D3|nr:DUF975 family protein [Alkaliphilus transvaalensis]
MWTRAELKSRAKSVLKAIYWRGLLVSLLVIISGNGSNGGINFNLRNNDRTHIWVDRVGDFLPSYNYSYSPTSLIFVVLMVALVMIIIGSLYRLLLGVHLEVGGRRFFIKAAIEKNAQLEEIGYTFNKRSYLSVVKTMLYRGVLLFLWTLLLIIPGIIKGYAYRMVPYILAENPNIGYKRAVELSNQMTKGQKMEIFILDLSFIGWYILGGLAFVVGIIFVMPYVNATNAELYLKLREKALEDGICTLSELEVEFQK